MIKSTGNEIKLKCHLFRTPDLFSFNIKFQNKIIFILSYDTIKGQ